MTEVEELFWKFLDDTNISEIIASLPATNNNDHGKVMVILTDILWQVLDIFANENIDINQILLQVLSLVQFLQSHFKNKKYLFSICK